MCSQLKSPIATIRMCLCTSVCTERVCLRWKCVPSFNSFIFVWSQFIGGSTRFTSSDSESYVLIYMPSIYFAAAVIHYYSVTMLTEGISINAIEHRPNVILLVGYNRQPPPHTEQNEMYTKQKLRPILKSTLLSFDLLSLRFFFFASSSKHTYPDCYCHCSLNCLAYDWQSFCIFLNSFMFSLQWWSISFVCRYHYRWAAICVNESQNNTTTISIYYYSIIINVQNMPGNCVLILQVFFFFFSRFLKNLRTISGCRAQSNQDHAILHGSWLLAHQNVIIQAGECS